MKESLFVTVTGAEGSGKGTALKKVAAILNAELIDVGDILRAIAAGRSLSLEKLHQQMAIDSSIDQELDSRNLLLPTQYSRLVLCSRTAWFLHPSSIRVLLTVDEIVGAKRVAQRQNVSVEIALAMNRKRIRDDAARYRTSLGIMNYPPPPEMFDVVVDSTDLSPELTIERLLGGIQAQLG